MWMRRVNGKRCWYLGDGAGARHRAEDLRQHVWVVGGEVEMEQEL